jgi:hypothetical protein
MTMWQLVHNLLNTDKPEHIFQEVYTPTGEVASNEITCAFWGFIFLPVYKNWPYNHQGTGETVALGMVVPDRK